MYREFIIKGEQETSDVKFLNENGWLEKNGSSDIETLKDQLSMLVRNFEARLRSEYEGIVNIRNTCVGVVNINA